jgi:cell division transport system ATP-binding protein
MHTKHHEASAPLFDGLEAEDTSAPAARLAGVTLAYRDNPQVLNGLNLDIPAGAFRYLIGPSGAGKSSLLRLIYLGQLPTAGRIELFGADTAGLSPSKLAALRRKVGVVFQDFRLLEGLSLLDNIALPRLIAGAAVVEARAEAAELLEWVGLTDRSDAEPASLSGGEQQRAAIARAVISRPSLILADEPTGSVDDAMADRLMALFEELNRQGAAVVMATHSIALIDRFPHPTIRLGDGQAHESAP